MKTLHILEWRAEHTETGTEGRVVPNRTTFTNWRGGVRIGYALPVTLFLAVGMVVRAEPVPTPPPVIEVEVEQDCPLPYEMLDIRRPPHELYELVQSKCSVVHQRPVGVVRRLTLKKGNGQSRSSPQCSGLGLRERKLSATLAWQQSNVGVGLPLCTGDVLVTWRGLEMSYVTFKPEKGANGQASGRMTFGEPGTLSAMGRLIFEDDKSTLMSGRLDYFFDPDYPEKRIALGVKGFGAGGAGTYVSMEVTDACRSEGLVLVPPQDAGAKGEVHQVKLCREEADGNHVCNVTVQEGQTRSILGETPSTLDEQVASAALFAASRESYGEQKALMTEARIKVPVKDNDYVAPPAPGRLKLSVQPQKSPVWLDGTRVTLVDGALEWSLSPGAHLVLVEGVDGKPQEQPLEIVSGREYPVTLDLRQSVAGIEWISIPGTGPDGFWMGSADKEGASDEHPRHKVTIQAFQMSKTEVTVAQYRACVEAGRCGERDLIVYDTCNWKKPGHDNYPINCIDWHQAKAFAVWVANSVPGVRLPSESEWEYAATGGGKTIYSGTNDLSKICEYGNVSDKVSKDKLKSSTVDCMDGYAETAPVGQFKDGAWGLKDLTGNVWEWVEDCYEGNYAKAPSDGSARKECSESYRVVRGGAWDYDGYRLRATDRDDWSPINRSSIVGFRLVRVPSIQ